MQASAIRMVVSGITNENRYLNKSIYYPNGFYLLFLGHPDFFNKSIFNQF